MGTAPITVHKDSSQQHASIGKTAFTGRIRLFCGSDRCGDRAAMMYSLIVTAKMNDLDSQAWLADVLARIAAQPSSLESIFAVCQKLPPFEPRLGSNPAGATPDLCAIVPKSR